MAKRRSRVKPRWVRELASRRVKELLALAEKEYEEHPERSNRYARLARETAKKYNIRLPPNYKKRICKKCGAFLVPGRNLKVKVSSSKKTVIYICQECGHEQRYGYQREKKKKINKQKNS